MANLKLFLLSLFCTVGLLTAANAQFSKTIHTSLELDEIKQIRLDLKGDVSVTEWEGNTLLIETYVEMYNSRQSVFTHFVEKAGRYDLVDKVQGGILTVESKDKIRKEISLKSGLCRETVSIKVFLPKNYKGSYPGPFLYQDDSTTTVSGN